MNLKDSYRHKGLRKAMVDSLKTKGIVHEGILQAFMNIPRHFFIEAAFADWAYKDVPFKIDADQTISQPYTVAFMTQLLDVKPGDKILEVGTGSGFQACILDYLGAKVYSIERQEVLYHKTGQLLRDIGFDRIRLFYGDGYQGYERFAPYDKVIVTAGAPEIPKALIEQLTIGGSLIIPVDCSDQHQEMVKIDRTGPNSFVKNSHGLFKFVPMLPGSN